MSNSPRIINVSNRLPVKIQSGTSGIKYSSSEGGLATGLSALFQRHDSLWIGWPGAAVDAAQEKKGS